MILPLILAGGTGSRLWPLSRELHPKQFLNLLTENSLFQETLKRVSSSDKMLSPIIVCNETHRFLVTEQLRQIDAKASKIILEPHNKGTAPAIALAAMWAISNMPEDTVILVLPADHHILETKQFTDAVIEAIDIAQKELVTFGISPTSAETGYGYMFPSHQIPDSNAYRIASFKEKPTLDEAKTFIKAGDCYWNSGIFLLNSKNYLTELKKHQSDMHETCIAAMLNAKQDGEFLRPNKEFFAACQANSIDYAIMEKTNRVAMFPLNVKWNDIGSWKSLWEMKQEKHSDNQGNIVKGDVILADTKNTYLDASHRLIAVLGVENLIVIESADTILIADKNKSQNVKDLVEQLKNQERQEIVNHLKAYRPWGWYEILSKNDGFLVKRICITPGSSISLQMHYHRSEHWIVIKGIAKVTCDDKVFQLEENQSTYIPMGIKHRLENVGDNSLEIVEIQTGAYLAEDDIVRFDDNYGRV